MSIEPGHYYFIACAKLNFIQPATHPIKLWSQVVEIEVELPQDGYGLEVSTPIVEYIGNMTQQIDILGVKVTCLGLELDNCDGNILNIHQY